MSFDLLGRDVHTFGTCGVSSVACGVNMSTDVTGLVEDLDPIERLLCEP